MGTCLSLKVKDEYRPFIEKLNEAWDKMFPGFEGLMRLTTEQDMVDWLFDIWNDKKFEHLHYIRTVSELNKVFPLWSLGCFQTQISLGEYLCAAMAIRYKRFLEKYADRYFEENPMEDKHIRKIVLDTIKSGERAGECLVECPFCLPVSFKPEATKIRKIK